MEAPPETQGESTPLTVGSTFFFKCDGEWPANLQRDKLELRLDSADKYKLKLLDFQFTTKTEAQLTVTSYKPGNHQLKAVQIVDPENSVVLGDLNFSIQSVINPQEPVSEPYGPVGPFSLSLPLWYPLTLILIVAVVGGWIFLKWRRRREKLRLLSEMRLNETAQNPYFQFYQALRKIQRNFTFFSGAAPQKEDTVKFVEELNQAYKIYLARVFEVPALAWSERKILSDLKRNHKEFYSRFRLQVRQGLAEIKRAHDAKKQMTTQDCQQLLDLLRKQVDQIDLWKKGLQK